MTRGKFVPYDHSLLLNRHLVAAAASSPMAKAHPVLRNSRLPVTRKLAISMPPQHGKSWLISQMFTTWLLGTLPDTSLLFCSYAADYAKRWGRNTRDQIEQFGPELFGVQVSQKTHAANDWSLQGHQGGMVTTGVGGPLTGRTGHVLIIDDPLKNSDEALSKATRERHKDWYRSTVSTRMDKDGVIVIVMTRWHEDDLVGWLLGAEDDWTVVNLPAIAFNPAELPEAERDILCPDPLGRAPGEALCPQLKPLSFLQRQEALLGPYWFAALYQQRPVPLAGGLFKRDWWQYWNAEELPVQFDQAAKCWKYPQHGILFDQVIQSWDFATVKTEYGSYCVGQVWGAKGPHRYLLDQVRARMDVPEMIVAVEKLSKKWPMAGAKLIEAKAAGPEVIKALRNKLPGLIPITPEGPKESRAAACTWQAQAGNVLLPPPTSYPWVEDFIGECASFPRAPYDDQVDAASQALNYLATSSTAPILTAQRRTNWSKFRF